MRDRRALLDGADRIDDAGARRDVVGAGGKLLDHRGVRLREHEVELEVGGVEVAVASARYRAARDWPRWRRPSRSGSVSAARARGAASDDRETEAQPSGAARTVAAHR